MNAKVKKALKILVWVVGLIILVPILLVATNPLWLGPIIRPSVNAIAPKLTKTAFNIDKLYLNPYTCNFELGGVVVGNPEGFSDANAVKLGYFNVDVDADTISKDVIVVDNVEVSDIYVTLLRNDEGKTNVDIIQENVLGAKEEESKSVELMEKEAAEAERKDQVLEEELKVEKEAMRFNKKIIVNHFAFKNVSGKLALSKNVVIPFAIPSIELKDIGRDSGGYDVDHLVAAIIKEFWSSVMTSAVDISNALGDKASKAINSLNDASNSLKGLFKKN